MEEKKNVSKEVMELAKKFQKNNDLCKIQFEQAMGELICCQYRVEFLAKMFLSQKNYDEFCKNVQDWWQKICISQKKDVTLQPEEGEKKPSTPSKKRVKD